MTQYNATRLPYSDELYHYGTPRHSGRYPYGSGANPYQRDPAHRKRKNGVPTTGQRLAEGAKAVGRVAGKGASRLGEGLERGIKTKLAEKFPFMLNDEEIEKYRQRLQLENTYRNAMAERRQAKKRSEGDKFVSNLMKDVASSTLKTVANKTVNKAMDEILKTADDREMEELDKQLKKYRLEKDKFDSETNKFKSKMVEDVSKNNEDMAKLRELDSKIAKEERDYLNKYDDIESIKSVERRIEKLKKERDNLNKDVQERDAQLSYRRKQFDTLLKENGSKTLSDVFENIGDKKKKSELTKFFKNLGINEDTIEDVLSEL